MCYSMRARMSRDSIEPLLGSPSLLIHIHTCMHAMLIHTYIHAYNVRVKTREDTSTHGPRYTGTDVENVACLLNSVSGETTF